GVADLLHHEIASEAAGSLDDDRPRAVALDPFEHGGEAGARVDGIGTAHGSVVGLADKLVASAAGACGDRFTLASVAVFVRSHVGRRAGPQIRNSRYFPLVGHDLASYFCMLISRILYKKRPAGQRRIEFAKFSLL